mgnify:FL=1
MSIYDPVKNLSGVGTKRMEALKQLGIETIMDLLTFYPFRYEDLRVRDIEDIEDREKVVLKGLAVSDGVVSYFGRTKSRLKFRLNVDQAIIPVTFFNQPYLKKQVQANHELTVFGTWDLKRQSLTGIKILKAEESDSQEAVYRSNKQIKQNTIFKLIKQAWDKYQDQIPQLIPYDLTQKYQLDDFPTAIRKIHFPNQDDDLARARTSLIFTEFFTYQLSLQKIRRDHSQTNPGSTLHYSLPDLKNFFKSLDFDLTGAQKRVVNEICKDLLQPKQMFRLLQGDVGSGKTVVAAAAIYAVFTGRKQAAIMAPTEILADQHFASFQDLFAGTDLKQALLKSSTPAKEREKILLDLAQGEIDLLVGTHALIQDDVIFKDLALVVIDEQHRFGVKQRGKLREKGQDPDVLAMTATPIPRTLSITAYGEMDTSIIDQMPAGRLPVKTIWLRNQNSSQMVNFIKRELDQGRQAYVVSPLIEESDNLDLQNALDLFDLYNQVFTGYQVGLLHGQMKKEERDQVMAAFKDNQVQILVSTTVIEVGVDVNNASVMVIHDADRFGLAQLHQLRGRVGRGTSQAYCILIADPKGENGVKRMQVMTESNDGFFLSEKDLAMRGPGDVLGSIQSGLPQFKIGDLVEDAPILEKARIESIHYLNQDPDLSQNIDLKTYLLYNQPNSKGLLD